MIAAAVLVLAAAAQPPEGQPDSYFDAEGCHWIKAAPVSRPTKRPPSLVVQFLRPPAPAASAPAKRKAKAKRKVAPPTPPGYVEDGCEEAAPPARFVSPPSEPSPPVALLEPPVEGPPPVPPETGFPPLFVVPLIPDEELPPCDCFGGPVPVFFLPGVPVPGPVVLSPPIPAIPEGPVWLYLLVSGLAAVLVLRLPSPRRT